jgi:diacylglycerol kinase family enzyme
MSKIAIINKDSGTSLSFTPEELERRIADAFERNGLNVDLRMVQGSDMEDALREAGNSSEETMIVGGGDGTINSGARVAIERQKVLGILPLGTMNRLAGDLGIPLDIEEAVHAIAHGRVVEIDAAEVNGHLFFCNSMFGIPAAFSELRDHARGQTFFSRLRRYFGEFIPAALAARQLAVAVDTGNGERVFRGLAFAIANNPYDETEVLRLRRSRLDTGKLGFYVTRHRNIFGLIWLMIRVLFGRWNGDPNFERLTADRIVVRSAKGKIMTTNDGEFEPLDSPLIYTIKPHALKLLLPANQ